MRLSRSNPVMLHSMRILGLLSVAVLLLVAPLANPAIAAEADPDSAPINLPMNSNASHPPVAAVASYAVAPGEVAKNGRFDEATADWTSARTDLRAVPSTLRKRGQALQVSTSALQQLAPDALTAGRSYTLVVKASVAGGSGLAAVRFREPKTGNTYRTYSVAVTSAVPEEYRVDFTAPAYTRLAEIALLAQGGAMSVESVSLKMRPPIVMTEPVASWDQSFTPPGYAMVFNDEFDGPELNRKKWFTRYISNNETLDRLNDENQRYADNGNHAIVDGKLQLVARRKPLSMPNGMNYESGMIRSDWTMHYGFLEARLRMPGGRGVWAAFWMISDVGETGRLNWPPEIDLFEFVNNVENDRVNMLHMAANTPKGTQPVWLYTDPRFKRTLQEWFAPFDFDKGWHTVGLEWTPHVLTYFVDGLKVMSREHAWTYADGVPAPAAQILLNLAIGGAWAGRHGIDDGAFPQSMDIDWIRAYQKPN